MQGFHRPIYTTSLEGVTLASDLQVANDLRDAYEQIFFQYEVRHRWPLHTIAARHCRRNAESLATRQNFSCWEAVKHLQELHPSLEGSNTGQDRDHLLLTQCCMGL